MDYTIDVTAVRGGKPTGMLLYPPMVIHKNIMLRGAAVPDAPGNEVPRHFNAGMGATYREQFGISEFIPVCIDGVYERGHRSEGIALFHPTPEGIMSSVKLHFHYKNKNQGLEGFRCHRVLDNGVFAWLATTDDLTSDLLTTDCVNLLKRKTKWVVPLRDQICVRMSERMSFCPWMSSNATMDVHHPPQVTKPGQT